MPAASPVRRSSDSTWPDASLSLVAKPTCNDASSHGIGMSIGAFHRLCSFTYLAGVRCLHPLPCTSGKSSPCRGWSFSCAFDASEVVNATTLVCKVIRVLATEALHGADGSRSADHQRSRIRCFTPSVQSIADMAAHDVPSPKCPVAIPLHHALNRTVQTWTGLSLRT